MKKVMLILASTLCGSGVLLAAELSTFTDILTPADVEQGSVKVHRLGADRFAVFFTYTDHGAKRMLSFSENHAGQKMITKVGEWASPVGIYYAPQDPVQYAMWKAGWLERRTSKLIVSNEADAQAIVAGLKSRASK